MLLAASTRGPALSAKPYTLYEVAGQERRRWPRVIMWILLVMVLIVAMGAWSCTFGQTTWSRRPTRSTVGRLGSDYDRPRPPAARDEETPRPGSQNIRRLGSGLRRGESAARAELTR
jgi:hypothetical protein